MTEFAWIRALQTDVALLAFALTVFCVAALWEHWNTKEGFAVVGGLAIKWSSALLIYAWLSVQYWFYGAEWTPFVPAWIRLTFLGGFLVGGSIILAAISPWWMPSWRVFWIWASTMAAITLLMAFVL